MLFEVSAVISLNFVISQRMTKKCLKNSGLSITPWPSSSMVYGFYCLRNQAPVSLENHDYCAFSPAQIIPFYGISILIYNVAAKLNRKSSVPPKGNFQKNDKKPSEFLLAFTALSIVVRVSKQSPKIVNIFKTVHISKYNDIF